MPFVGFFYLLHCKGSYQLGELRSSLLRWLQHTRQIEKAAARNHGFFLTQQKHF